LQPHLNLFATPVDWILFAKVGSNLLMMDWSEGLGFSIGWKVACARRVHREIKENLAKAKVSRGGSSQCRLMFETELVGFGGRQ